MYIRALPNLTTVGEVRPKGKNIRFWDWKICEIHIEHLIATFDELWDSMSPSFATASCKYNSFSVGRHHES